MTHRFQMKFLSEQYLFVIVVNFLPMPSPKFSDVISVFFSDLVPVVLSVILDVIVVVLRVILDVFLMFSKFSVVITVVSFVFHMIQSDFMITII